MKIVKVDSVVLFDNPHGVEAKILYDKEDCKTVFLSLKPNQALKLHTTPIDVFFIFLRVGVMLLLEKRRKRLLEIC